MSHSARVRFVGILSLLLPAAAGLLLCSGNQPAPAAEEFQYLVGGLGGGPAADFGDCPFAFDPRLESDCTFRHGPVPAGGCFCGRHSCSVRAYRPANFGEADGRLP
jgi:hypothetical protein